MHCNSTVTSTGNFVASRSYCIFTVVTFYSVTYKYSIVFFLNPNESIVIYTMYHKYTVFHGRHIYFEWEVIHRKESS